MVENDETAAFSQMKFRDEGKRLTRFMVAIRHMNSLEITMGLPGGKAVAKIGL
jgi:hypothetical protein